MKPCKSLAIWLVTSLVSPASAVGQSSDERFWISRERISSGVDNCRGDDCPRYSEFTTRLFDPDKKDQMRRLMALLDFQAAANGLPLEHPETPEFCARQLPNPNQVIWNPEWMQTSHKLEALRGLEAIHVDVSGLKAPEGFEGPFGEALQEELEVKFAAAGIPIVDKEEIERVPGQPKLQVFFSATNPDSGCWWSVFATMTQTALLTRDISVKISAGTWAHMKGFDPDNLEMTEYSAISGVFDQFVSDYKEANAEDFEPVNTVPYVDLLGRPMTIPEVHVKPYAEIKLEPRDVDPEAQTDDAKDPPEYSPLAQKPELSPKALKRIQATNGQLPQTDLEGEVEFEKVTLTGGGSSGS